MVMSFFATAIRTSLYTLVMSFFAICTSLYTLVMSFFAIRTSLYTLVMSFFAIHTSLYTLVMSFFAIRTSLYTVGQLLCYSLVIVYAQNINVVAFRYYCVYAKQQQQQKYDAYVEFARGVSYFETCVAHTFLSSK